MPPRERFTLTIQNAGDHNNVPVAPRLRRLLKAMLRAYGIRCVDIRPAESVSKPTTKSAGGIMVEQYSTNGYPSDDETETNNPDGSTAALHRSG